MIGKCICFIWPRWKLSDFKYSPNYIQTCTHTKQACVYILYDPITTWLTWNIHSKNDEMTSCNSNSLWHIRCNMMPWNSFKHNSSKWYIYSWTYWVSTTAVNNKPLTAIYLQQLTCAIQTPSQTSVIACKYGKSEEYLYSCSVDYCNAHQKLPVHVYCFTLSNNTSIPVTYIHPSIIPLWQNQVREIS